MSRGWLVPLVVIAAVLIAHGAAITTGWFQDDHLHLQNLQSADWSWASLVESSRLQFVGGALQLWGQPTVEIQFFRPVAFALMKLEYTVFGWDPMPAHIVSLGLHAGCCLLMSLLAYRLLRSSLWAGFAGVWLAIHPAHVATVQWIACQTELMTTLFLLTATLAYARYAGWRPLVESPAAQAPDLPARTAGVLAVVCYALALGCRENALLFPAVCWIGDRVLPGKRRTLFNGALAAMAVILVAYFVARAQAGLDTSIPDRPYAVPPTDPEFLSFISRKLMYYLVGIFFFVPIVPKGGMAFFTHNIHWLLLGVVGLAAFLVMTWRMYKPGRVLIWPLAWIGCFLLPLLPVFASSHHAYLPSIGACLIGAMFFYRWQYPAADRKRWIVVPLALGYLGAVSGMTWMSVFAYQNGTVPEDIVVENVIRHSREIAPGDQLFFINMPLLAYCAVPAIEQKLSLPDLTGHALTFSPWLMRMESPGTLEVLDDHRIRVQAPDSGRYLAGISGRMFLDVMGFDRVPAPGDSIDAGPYTVKVEAGDESGIRSLLFTFRRPVTSPDYHFYFGSPYFLAYPLDMARLMPDSTSTTVGTGAKRREPL